MGCREHPEAIQMTDSDIIIKKIEKNKEDVFQIMRKADSLFKAKEQYILNSKKSDKIKFAIYLLSILSCFLLNIHFSANVLLLGVMALDLYLYARKLKKMTEYLSKYLEDMEIKRKELIVLANELLNTIDSDQY